MEDNKAKTDGRDNSKVDKNDPFEVEFLHREWKQFSHSQIKEGIEKYGPERDKIEDYLNSKSGSM